MTDVEPYWDGAVNLSDLGGIPIKTGFTASGRIFRSASRAFMTETGWADARAAGVTTIIDLRNADELAPRDGNPAVREHARAGIYIAHTPTEDQEDPEFMRVCGPWLDHPNYYAPNLAMFPGKFKAVFEAIAAADGAVLVHCAGGRDRTGMISAMLLKIAGARPSVIAENYADGFRGIWPWFLEHLDRYPHEGATAEELEARVADRVPVLIDWIAGFDVEAYLIEAGLSRGDVANLKARLAD